MEWSPVQRQALDAVGEWLKTGHDGQQIFRLFGYAGTGKTTLARHLSQSAGYVGFAAFTGKAASVLRSKGCLGAQTIHSLIYQPRERGTSRLTDLQSQLETLIEKLSAENQDISADNNVQDLRRRIDEEKKVQRKPLFELKVETSALREMDLLVIDECSMVGNEMAHDMLSFGKKILVLGDPAQLPPVKSSGFFTKATPDILLTEIHRQAQDNPIIAIATRIRNGYPLTLGDYGESRVITREQAKEERHTMYTGHDQMIVGRNITRRGSNNAIREMRGFGITPFPVTGDKLVCLRNNGLLGLLNGTLWNCKQSSEIAHTGRIMLDIEPLDGVGMAMQVKSHDHFFRGEEPSFYEMREAECFDFGYALTCHKAQGSQWDSVLIVDESSCFKTDAERWLYTAVTRAANRVTVVK